LIYLFIYSLGERTSGTGKGGIASTAGYRIDVTTTESETLAAGTGLMINVNLCCTSFPLFDLDLHTFNLDLHKVVI
jgi:hypothetical protein